MDDPDSNETPPPPSNWWKAALIILLALVVLGASAFGIMRRIRKTKPDQAAIPLDSDEQRLLLWYRAILLVLSQQGQAPTGGETPFQFAQRLIASGIAPPTLNDLVQALADCQYANKPPAPGVFEAADLIYKQLAEQLKPMERLRWWWQRLVHGLGSIQNIP